MGRYKYELWLGKATSYWNWEVKGIPDDEYPTRIEFINKCIAELEDVKDYYQSLTKKEE